jgi:hypothetical protein
LRRRLIEMQSLSLHHSAFDGSFRLRRPHTGLPETGGSKTATPLKAPMGTGTPKNPIAPHRVTIRSAVEAFLDGEQGRHLRKGTAGHLTASPESTISAPFLQNHPKG